MTTADIHQVTCFQVLDNQQLLNVYFYRQMTDAFVDASGATNDAGTCLDRFIALALPGIQGCQSARVQYTSVQVRNLFDDADAAERLVNSTGSADGTAQETLPGFNSYGFRLAGEGFEVKDGAKRLAGVCELRQINGTITDFTQVAKLALAAAAINRTLTVGADTPVNTVWRPVVVKRVRSGVKPDYVYRLPETLAESVFTYVINTLWTNIVTSQVSRKIGR